MLFLSSSCDREEEGFNFFFLFYYFSTSPCGVCLRRHKCVPSLFVSPPRHRIRRAPMHLNSETGVVLWVDELRVCVLSRLP